MCSSDLWEENPTGAAPKSKAFIGMLGAPLMLVFFGGLAAPGLVFLKKAALAGLMKASSVAGGAVGYATADDHGLAVRKACVKALDSFKIGELT